MSAIRTVVCTSGGGSRGAFQGGAIEALTERGIVIDGLVGVSTGSIQAGFMSQATPDDLQDQAAHVEKLKQLWFGLKRLDVYDKLSFFEAIALVLKRRSHLYDFKLASLLADVITSAPKRPLRLGIVDLKSGEFVESDPKSPETLRESIVASSSIPVAFSPVGTLVDGGVRDVAPVDAGFKLAREMGVDDGDDLRMYIVLASPAQILPDNGEFRSIDRVGLRSLELLQAENYLWDLRHAIELNELIPFFKDRPIEEWPKILMAGLKPKLHVTPILIDPDPSYPMYNSLEFNSDAIKRFWEHGRERALEKLDAEEQRD
jgi:predicted acylesterase/phospholipase RssA